MYRSLFNNEVAGVHVATLSKNKLQHRYFPVDFAKCFKHLFYRTPPDDRFCGI